MRNEALDTDEIKNFAKSISGLLDVFAEIDADGDNGDFTFTDDEGNKVVLSYEELEGCDQKALVIELDNAIVVATPIKQNSDR